MAGAEDKSHAGSISNVTLVVLVALGAVGIGLVWTALNRLLTTSALTGDVVLGLLAGALIVTAVGAWLWRSLNALVPDSPHNRGRR
jgi:hypothetical protein